MSKPETPETIRISLPSRLELLSFLDRLAAMVCDRMAFDEDTSAQVTMSVIEAGTNAIQHGHQRDPSKTFEVVFDLFPDRLEVTCHDSGQGFDLALVSGDITSPEHLFEPRGRGIYIMRACMDSVEFDFAPGGTTCRLLKRRPAVSVATG